MVVSCLEMRRKVYIEEDNKITDESESDKNKLSKE
jgi:hypothetical protein